jgi:ubiquinone biosynthesis protein COQ4
MRSQPSPPSPSVDLAALPAHERWRRALRALARVLVDPEQTDQVLVFSNLANAGRRDELMQAFFDDPRGRALYEQRRLLDSRTIDLDALARLPEGTLGHAYATFMRSHGLTPEVFDAAPENVQDPRAVYIIQRMRQSHDLWHVVTHAETDPAGEIALQAFTFAQLRAPAAGILAVLGTLRSLRLTREVARDALELFRIGRAAEPLAVFAWEDHWATPLAEVRRRLGLPPTPRRYGGYLDLQKAA